MKNIDSLQAMYPNVFHNKLMCSSSLKRDKNLHDDIVSAKCKQGSHRLVLKIFSYISRKKSQISMGILNITKRRETECNSYCLLTLEPPLGVFMKIKSSYLICLTHWGRVMHICFSKKKTFVQIMACRLIGAKPLSEPMLEYCYWTGRNKLQWKFNWNSYFIIQENVFEKVVWKIAAILSQPQCIYNV